MTYQEALTYFITQEKYKVKSPDINLELIQRMLFEIFGGKEPKKATLENLVGTGLPVAEVSKIEKEAWIKAGYPPFVKWIKEYRNDNKPTEQQ